ncbi:MAG: hypothetical protein LPJ89_01240 [Hymenobacteraceae bacterium]|nr:hypothetical protein [Hymenobacteraceae bacterium]
MLKDAKIKYVLIAFLCLFIITLFSILDSFRDTKICEGSDCLILILLNILVALVHNIILAFSVISTFSSNKKKLLPLCLLLSGAVYFFMFISVFSAYAISVTHLLIFNLLINAAVFIWVLAKAFEEKSAVKPVYILLSFLAIFVLSSWYAIEHMADGGCDGGLCGIIILIIPVFIIPYLLLFIGFAAAKSNKIYKNIIGFISCIIASGISYSFYSELDGFSYQNEWARYLLLTTPLSFTFVFAFVVHFVKKAIPAIEPEEETI